jgi:hypothetical protein
MKISTLYLLGVYSCLSNALTTSDVFHLASNNAGGNCGTQMATINSWFSDVNLLVDQLVADLNALDTTKPSTSNAALDRNLRSWFKLTLSNGAYGPTDTQNAKSIAGMQ